MRYQSYRTGSPVRKPVPKNPLPLQGLELRDSFAAPQHPADAGGDQYEELLDVVRPPLEQPVDRSRSGTDETRHFIGTDSFPPYTITSVSSSRTLTNTSTLSETRKVLAAMIRDCRDRINSLDARLRKAGL